MKKLLFLLLLPILAFAQVSTGKEQKFLNGIRNLAPQTVTDPVYLVSQGIDGTEGKVSPHNLPVPTSVIDSLELKTANSSGAVSGFTVTNNGDGTVNIDEGIAYLKSTNDPYAPIVKYTIPAVTNLSLTDNANNYILVDYNGGTPAITVTTNPATINTQTNSLAIVVARVGTTLDYLSLVGQNVDANAKLRIRFLNQEGIRRASGATLGFSSRNLTLTPGVLFSGLIRVGTLEFNTASPDTFTMAYNNGSVWTRTTGQTQVNNTQYNVSGVLTTMPNNTFRTDYVYLLPNNPSKLYVIMGTATYGSLTLAKAAPRPSSLPVELQALGLEVGRLFIEKNSAVIAEVQSTFSNEFVGASVPEHNSLTGLQGGTSGEFNHLTNAQVDLVNSVPSKTEGSGASGRVSFWNGTNSLSSNSGFLWDNTNNIFEVKGKITNTATHTSLNRHGFDDYSILNITTPDPGGYASFDSYIDINNSENIDHVSLYQARPKFYGSGDILSHLVGMGIGLTHNGTGNINQSYGVDINAPVFNSSGRVMYNRGLNIGDFSTGGIIDNYAIRIAGGEIYGGNGLSLNGANPYMQINQTDGATNEKFSDVLINDDVMVFRFLNDAKSSASNWLTVTRSGETPVSGVFGMPISATSYTGGAALTGTPTAPTPTTSDGIANKSYVDGLSRPYKVYTALVLQSGTAAPISTVLENSLSGIPTWTYNSAGNYTLTLAGEFTTNKTYVSTISTANPAIFATANVSSVNDIVVQTRTTAGVGQDAVLGNNHSRIEIRVYP